MDTQMTAPTKSRKHFLYKHPLFKSKRTRQGIWYENSPYYLWWRYLRLNKIYEQMCLGNLPTDEVYDFFGNIHAYEDTKEGFSKWFREYGENIFCELRNPNLVVELDEADNVDGWRDGGRIIVSIPTQQNTEWVMKQLNRIVSKHRDAAEKRKDKGKPPSSSAQFTFYKEPDVPALKRYLAIYELKNTPKDDGKFRTYAQVGKNFFGNRVDLESAKAMAYRMNKSATQIIENTLYGEFPKFSVRK